MKLSVLILADLIFLLLNSVSALFSGPLRIALSVLAHLVAALAVLIYAKINALPVAPRLPDRRFLYTLPAVFPSVALIFLLSYLTSLLLSLFGAVPTGGLSGNLGYDLAVSALLPALLEELLFRYAPLRLLHGEHPRYVLFVSALLFALCHVDLFRIPYAFAAGLIFAALDIACGSVLPSVLLHFVNNALSILWTYFFEGTHELLYLSLLGALALISLFVLFLFRGKFRELLSPFCEKDDRKRGIHPVLLVFCAGMLFLSVFQFISTII